MKHIVTILLIIIGILSWNGCNFGEDELKKGYEIFCNIVFIVSIIFSIFHFAYLIAFDSDND